MADKTFDLSILFKMVDRFSSPLKQMTHNLTKVVNQIGKADTVMSRFGQTMQKSGKKISSVGRNMTTKLTLPLTILGGLSLRTASSFQEAMNMVGAVTQTKIGKQTTPEFEKLNARARELGATTQFTATDVANAMKFMAMAGMQTTDILGGVPHVLSLAASANLDMAGAADIITNIMASQQMGVEDLTRATDILTNVFTNANIDLSQLGQAFKYAGSLSKAAGMDMETAAAALGMMGNMGIQATMAGRGLRMGFKELAKPSKEAISLFGKANVKLFELGTDGKRHLRNLSDIVNDMHKGGLTTMDLMMVMSANSATALGALVDGTIMTRDGMLEAGDAMKWLEEKARKMGTTANIAATQMTGLPGALKSLSSAWQEIQIKVFSDTSFGKSTEEFLNNLVTLLRNIADTNPELVSMFAIFATFLAVLGPIVTGIGMFVFAVGSIATFIGPIGIILGILTLVGMAIVGIRGLIKGIPVLIDDTINGFKKLYNEIIEFFGYLPKFVSGVVSQVAGDVERMVTSVADKLKGLIPDWVKDSFTGSGEDGIQGQSILDQARKNNMGKNTDQLIQQSTQESKAEITVKVTSDNGTSATIDKVNKKGNTNLNVINDAYLGMGGAAMGF